MARGITKRSERMTRGITRAPHRSLLKALGLTDREISRPLIGIASSASEVVPGHIHLRQIEEAVKRGVVMAGGTPLVFSTIAVCDGLAMDHAGMRYSLPSRELIADSIEIMAQATPFDGLVFISNCDKVTPAMLMAMGRLNLPSLIVSGGPMLAGQKQGKHIDLVSVFAGVAEVKSGRLSEKSLAEMEEDACPCAGSCAGLFTANTMNSLCEALGVALRGNGTIPAVYSERLRLAKESGIQVMELLKNRTTPRDIVSEDSLFNAVAVDLAMGGSTNTVLHLAAIALNFALPFAIETFDTMSRRVPRLCSLSPVGEHHIQDLHHSGGVLAVMKVLNEAGIIRSNAATVQGKSLGALLAEVETGGSGVIRPLSNPYSPEGGIGIISGNLAPGGAVVKLSGVPDELRLHTGPAVVFEDGETAAQEILKGVIKKGDVVVIRNEGPRGGPGMREMLSPTSALVGMGLEKDVILITDGRFSGGSTGAIIGHISPEAADGGLIAVVKDGDKIRLDVGKRLLNLELDRVELAKRLKDFSFSRAFPGGYLGRYAQMVRSSGSGAVFREKLT